MLTATIISIIIIITVIDEYVNMFMEYVFKDLHSIEPLRQIVRNQLIVINLL